MKIEANPTSYFLKIHYEHPVRVKQSVTVNRIFSEALFKSTLSKMYEEIALERGAIKLTLNVSNFTSQHTRTLSLMDLDEDIKQQALSAKLHKLRERFGLDIIKTADEL